MSRIGNKPILLPADVNVTLNGNNIHVKGPKGELSFDFDTNLNVVVEGNELHVKRPNDSKWMKTIHGTTRALIHNMVEGVSKGFTKSLEINGVGYRAALQGNTVVLTVGYNISGIDKQLVGQFAAEIREVRKPEPYKGKGIKYSDEHIRRKEGKTAKK